jgi:hypothetical protein
MITQSHRQLRGMAHSHDDGERAVDAVLFTLQASTNHSSPECPRDIPTGESTRNCETRVDLVRAESPVMSCDVHVLVQQAAEPVSS